MLWLPKWLKDNGDRLEAEMPSRRRFLILGAAAAVGAALPEPASPFNWKVPSPVGYIDRNLCARVRIACIGTPSQIDPAWMLAVKHEIEATALDIQARGLAGLVQHRGLYVPKDAPAYRALWDHFRPSAAQRKYLEQWASEPRYDHGQPAHDDTDYAREYTWLGLDRGER